VDICVDCNPAFFAGVRIVGIHYDLNQSGCLGEGPAFWNFVQAQISDPNLYWTTLCYPIWSTPDCESENRHYFRVYWYYCWKTYLYRDENQHLKRGYIPCDDVYCEEEFETCFNYSTNKFEVLTSTTKGPIGGTPNCSQYYFEITIPTQENVYSDCFIRNSVMPCPME
jgi:hypothetical protein